MLTRLQTALKIEAILRALHQKKSSALRKRKNVILALELKPIHY
jgi:hypothetical protein